MPFDPVLLALAGSVAVLAMVLVAAIPGVMGQPSRKAQRVRSLRKRWAATRAEKIEEAAAESIRGREKAPPLPIALLLRLMPHPERLRARLDQTGLPLTPTRYLLMALILGLLAGLFALSGLKLSPLIATLIGIGVGMWGPSLAVGHLIGKRQAGFTAAFPEAIDLMVRGIKSGLPITECMKAVGTELRGPIAEEFSALSNAQQFGQTLEEALNRMAARIDTPEAKFFVTALAVQKETGGNLSETLENLSQVLRSRYQMKQKIKALSAEPTASASILGALPIIMFGIILVVNTAYAMELFNDPRGHVMIAVGLTMQGMGIAVMIKMINFEI